MANIIFPKELSIEDKINIMQEDSKYDVAGSVDIINQCVPDLSMLRDIKSKKAPPTVPKVSLSNDCIFNCAYCVSRSSRDENHRYCNTPNELAKMAVQQAIKSRHGIFVTSAIYKNADYTQELIIETLRIIRNVIGYKGYVHAKVMPGTDPILIKRTGDYASRLSVNIEVAKHEGYEKIAKQKNKKNILTPMGQISDLIKDGKSDKSIYKKKFASSQTTQLMAGSTDEDDRTILTLSKALYKKYSLKRVYYTPFHYTNPAKGYDLPLKRTPYWRMRRLYQADRLMELYGFTPDDIAPEQQPFLEGDLDPKLSWALRNLHLFPIEVNKADFFMLIRIPGIGVTYANKIIKARKYYTITHSILRKIGVSLKRCIYFIECDGKYFGRNVLDNEVFLHGLLSDNQAGRIKQISFFDHYT